MGYACPPSCPFVAPMREELTFPVGQVRHLAAADKGEEVDETRRNVLKLAAVAGLLGAGGLGFAGGALQYAQPPVVGLTSYPRVQLLDIDGSALTVDKVASEYSVYTSELLLFNYPLQNEPNFFLNLDAPPGGSGGAQHVPGGIGPNGSIVAYSAICQHLGCPAPAIEYYPPGTCGTSFNGRDFYIHCSCHGSTYDVANGAANLTGPAVLPLPQVVLEADASGNIFATGMTANSPPVNGHLDTLQGDYGVPSSVQLAKQTPTPPDCFFPS